MGERKRLNLGNLNPIYERELTKLDVHQEEGRWSVSKDGAGRIGLWVDLGPRGDCTPQPFGLRLG